MSGDDPGIPVFWDYEPPPGAMPGLPQDGPAEVQAYGTPVQDQRASSRRVHDYRRGRHAYGAPARYRPAWLLAGLGAIAALALALATVSLWAAVTEYLPHHKQTGGMVDLAQYPGILAMILAVVVMGEKPSRVSKLLGVMILAVALVAGILGLVDNAMAYPLWCPNCTP
jgi:hypothetical protein